MLSPLYTGVVIMVVVLSSPHCCYNCYYCNDDITYCYYCGFYLVIIMHSMILCHHKYLAKSFYVNA